MSKKNIYYILGSVILGIISSAIYDFIKSEKLFTTLLNILAFLKKATLTLLNYNIKIYALIISWLIYIIIKSIYKKYTVKENKPAFLSYTEDRFKNVIWKWNWRKNSNGEWVINNLWPYCPNCDIEILNNKGSYLDQYSECPKCETKYNSRYGNSNLIIEDTDKVEALIIDNAKKGNYRKLRN